MLAIGGPQRKNRFVGDPSPLLRLTHEQIAASASHPRLCDSVLARRAAMQAASSRYSIVGWERLRGESRLPELDAGSESLYGHSLGSLPTRRVRNS